MPLWLTDFLKMNNNILKSKLSRRDFAIASSVLLLSKSGSAKKATDFPVVRTTQRNFKSQVVEDTIERIKSKCKDQEIAWLFENCFPNTLDTTVRFNEKPDTFVITGDINAMWLKIKFGGGVMEGILFQL